MEEELITEADIALIGSRWLGLRHVSTRERGEVEQRDGFDVGGSLNLSFHRTERNIVNFVDLLPDADVEKELVVASRKNPPLLKTRQTGQHKYNRTLSEGMGPQELVSQYEFAIRKFIEESAETDLATRSNVSSVDDVRQSLEETAFLLVEYNPPNVPSIGDVREYHGLGKYRSGSVPAGNLVLLPAVGPENHNTLDIFAHFVMQNLLDMLRSGWHGTAGRDENSSSS